MQPEEAADVSAVRERWQASYARSGPCCESFGRFRAIIYDHYRRQGRRFSWRDRITPYRVMVSEVMLQQTQTSRVAEKFEPFVQLFPDFQTLARAAFSDVLTHWKGLGYNRRARYLHDSARMVVNDFDGILPQEPEILVSLPGIGRATAASICAFAFDLPVIFIETNIRAVFIHFFFNGREQVHDRDIEPLIGQSLDRRQPRHWYYALMDYGAMLKKTTANPGRRSVHYSRQSRFAGSDRELRGRILQLLLERRSVERAELPGLLAEPPVRIDRLVDALCREHLVAQRESRLTLA